MNVDQVIAAYIKLRDTAEEIKERHKQELAKVNDQMHKLEGWLHKSLQAQGLTNFKGAAGTAFLQTVSSATVADRETFFNYVRENQAWELLESRCAKTVVDDYLESHGEAPPGIKHERTEVIRIRRG